MAHFANLLARLEQALFGRLPEHVRHNTRVELLASILYGGFFAGTLAFLPVVLRRLGADTSQLALYVTLTYVGQLFAPLSLTILRHMPALKFASVVWGAGRGIFVMALFVTDSRWLLVLAGLFWIAEMLPSAAYAQIMRQVYPPRARGRAMSGVRIGMTIAVLILTPLAGYFLDQFGYQLLLALGGIFGAVSAIVFAALRPVEPPGPPPTSLPPRAMIALLRSDRRFSWYLLALTIYGLGSVMALPLFPIVQVSRLGLSYSQIGLLGVAQSLFWLVGFFFWGRLLDQRGGVWMLRLGMILAGVVSFTYIWAVDPWTLLPAFVAQGLLQGAFELGIMNTAIDLADKGRVLEYTALQALSVGVRGIVAPFISAGLIGLGLPDRSVFAICVALIAAAVLMMGRIQTPARVAPDPPADPEG